MLEAPINPPPGARFEERPDGFVVSATTRAQWFVILYISIWVFFWLGVMGNITPLASRSHAVGAKIMVSVLWLAVAIQLFGYLLILFGRYTLTVQNDRATLALSVALLRWKRRFTWSAVTSISWQHSPRKGAPPWILLSLAGGRRIRFGSVIRTDRRHYVYDILQQQLARN